MEWFEKEYKKRFEGESSLEGVDANALWNQISESIPQKKPVFPYWKWSLFALFVVGTAAIWILIQNDNPSSDLLSTHTNAPVQAIENQPENIITNENIIANTQDITIENSTQILTENSEDYTNNSEVRNDNKASKSQNVTTLEDNKEVNSISPSLTSNGKLNESKTPERSSSFAQSNAQKSTVLNRSLSSNTNSKSGSNSESNTNTVSDTDTEFKSKSNLHEPAESSFNNSDSKLMATDKNHMTIDENSERVSTNNEANLNTVSRRDLIEIRKLDLSRIDGLHKQSNIDIPPVSPQIITIKRKNPFAIGVQTKINFFDLKYSDDQNAEIFASDSNASLGLMQIGNSFAINIDYQFDRSWSINTGIELNNYENHLNTIITSDTMLLDGMQKIRKGKNIRTIKHHNKLSTYTIPISLTYENRMSDKWSIGASLGASYSLIKSQRGKFLSRNDIIVVYTDQENKQFNNFLSLRVNPFLKYGISDKISLSLNAGLSIQSHGRAEIQDLTQSSIIYSTGIGLQYKM